MAIEVDFPNNQRLVTLFDTNNANNSCACWTSLTVSNHYKSKCSVLTVGFTIRSNIKPLWLLVDINNAKSNMLKVWNKRFWVDKTNHYSVEKRSNQSIINMQCNLLFTWLHWLGCYFIYVYNRDMITFQTLLVIQNAKRILNNILQYFTVFHNGINRYQTLEIQFVHILSLIGNFLYFLKNEKECQDVYSN